MSKNIEAGKKFFKDRLFHWSYNQHYLYCFKNVSYGGGGLIMFYSLPTDNLYLFNYKRCNRKRQITAVAEDTGFSFPDSYDQELRPDGCTCMSSCSERTPEFILRMAKNTDDKVIARTLGRIYTEELATINKQIRYKAFNL